jgi:16S rRNA (adenine1518-N6/adenine1519-N6)-dimethyltransferase
MSILALSVQVYGMPRVAKRIPASAFFPIPMVDSAILCIDIYPSPQVDDDLLNIFFLLIKAGFGQKRKTLRNSLSSGLHIPPTATEDMLAHTNIDPMRRAETLEIKEWIALSELYKQQRLPE